MSSGENDASNKLARTLLLVSTKSAVASLSGFSDWLMVGLGASFTAVAAKWSEVSNFVHISYLRWVFGLYVVALVAGVVARLLRAAVEAGISVNETLPKAIEAMQLGQVRLDNVMATYGKGMIWPYSLLLRREADAETHGLALISRLSQRHALLVLLSALCGIIAVGLLAIGFNT